MWVTYWQSVPSQKESTKNRSQNADCWWQSSECSRSEAARVKWKQIEEHQSSLPNNLPRKIPRNAGEPPLKDRYITPPWGTATKDIFKLLSVGFRGKSDLECTFWRQWVGTVAILAMEILWCLFSLRKRYTKPRCFFALYWWLPICFFQHHVSS